MEKNSRIFVAGHGGLVGKAIVKVLKEQGYENILTVSSLKVDLRDSREVGLFFAKHEPDYVFMAAALVRGIEGNMKIPADMIFDNLRIQMNLMRESCFEEDGGGVKKLLFLGSSCIYPKMCQQPIKEEYLMTGPLEPSNEFYAIAKIAGVKMCQSLRRQYDYDAISVMPCNLYGPGDRYIGGGHVIPDLIRRFHAAKNGYQPIICWGDGTARREFLYSEDLARACVVCMEKYSAEEPINIGVGHDITIHDLAHGLAEIVGIDHNRITWDTSKPAGTPRKVLDCTKIQALGWQPTMSMREGLKIAYADYLSGGRYGRVP
jgi:GDP-L-fucose synthase